MKDIPKKVGSRIYKISKPTYKNEDEREKALIKLLVEIVVETIMNECYVLLPEESGYQHITRRKSK